MSRITFKRINPDESRIYDDGDCVGEVYRLPDILNAGAPCYIVHLSEDYRGPVRVRERHLAPVVPCRIRSRAAAAALRFRSRNLIP